MENHLTSKKVLGDSYYSGANCEIFDYNTLIPELINQLKAKPNGVYALSGWWSGHANDYTGIGVRKSYGSQIRTFGIFIDNNNNTTIYHFNSINDDKHWGTIKS